MEGELLQACLCDTKEEKEPQIMQSCMDCMCYTLLAGPGRLVTSTLVSVWHFAGHSHNDDSVQTSVCLSPVAVHSPTAG